MFGIASAAFSQVLFSLNTDLIEYRNTAPGRYLKIETSEEGGALTSSLSRHMTKQERMFALDRCRPRSLPPRLRKVELSIPVRRSMIERRGLKKAYGVLVIL